MASSEMKSCRARLEEARYSQHPRDRARRQEAAGILIALFDDVTDRMSLSRNSRIPRSFSN